MKSGTGTQEAKLGEQLAYLVSCTNTIKVLTVLAEREASPKDIGKTLGLSTPTASHHVKKLVRLNLVEKTEEIDVGGTIQHFYRAKIRPLVDTEEWDKLDIEERQRFSIWIVRLVLADAAVSFDAGLFDAHSNRHLSRTPMVVDDEGLDEVAEIQNDALYKILASQSAISDRLRESGSPGTHIIAAMMCFVLPGPSVGPSEILFEDRK